MLRRLSYFGACAACYCVLGCSAPSDGDSEVNGSNGSNGSQGSGDNAGVNDDDIANLMINDDTGSDPDRLVNMGDGTCGSNLTGIVRDFKSSHPDFENTDKEFPGKMYGPQDLGIVGTELGEDGKPVYAGPADGTLSTTGPENFSSWFHDVDGVNVGDGVTPMQHTLVFEDLGDGTFEVDTDAFFPIDGQGWDVVEPNGVFRDDRGVQHNFHFTFELHTVFQYNAGDTFTFRGDDDVGVFINGQLVVDIGGVHLPIEKSVTLDELGLTEGQEYPLDFFFAERHTSQSNFRITTSLVFTKCGIIK